MNMEQYVNEFYNHHDNYKVIDQPQATEADLAVIYFASVGLFSDKNYATRLDNDYYEFHRNPVKRAGRLIYVRDVTLTFYQDGINAQINNLDKLFELLSELTKGYHVITVGISGGGYMAMLAGGFLKADYAISESGIGNLDFMQPHLDRMPWIGKWLPGTKSKYWNLVEFVQQNPVLVYQFEAYYYEGDRANAALVAQIPTVRFFNINCYSHGSVLDSPAIGAFINLNGAQIEKLYHQSEGKVVSRFWFNCKVLSLWKLLKFYGKKLRKNLLKVKFSKKEKLLIIFGVPLINTTSNNQR